MSLCVQSNTVLQCSAAAAAVLREWLSFEEVRGHHRQAAASQLSSKALEGKRESQLFTFYPLLHSVMGHFLSLHLSNFCIKFHSSALTLYTHTQLEVSMCH